jgi:hypothetical protein
VFRFYETNNKMRPPHDFQYWIQRIQEDYDFNLDTSHYYHVYKEFNETRNDLIRVLDLMDIQSKVKEIGVVSYDDEHESVWASVCFEEQLPLLSEMKVGRVNLCFSDSHTFCLAITTNNDKHTTSHQMCLVTKETLEKYFGFCKD